MVAIRSGWDCETMDEGSILSDVLVSAAFYLGSILPPSSQIPDVGLLQSDRIKRL
jgi:hypothetical protein